MNIYLNTCGLLWYFKVLRKGLIHARTSNIFVNTVTVHSAVLSFTTGTSSTRIFASNLKHNVAIYIRGRPFDLCGGGVAEEMLVVRTFLFRTFSNAYSFFSKIFRSVHFFSTVIMVRALSFFCHYFYLNTK